MPLDEPGWWYSRDGEQRLAARLLAPFADLYGAVVERRFKAAVPHRTALPVICVGNFTAGGTGKTPLTRYLVEMLTARGVSSACLSRGYGGKLAGPVWVDPARHAAVDVGDEPLLIAQGARVMVSRDRKAGLDAIAADGSVQAVVMDDGLQNPSLKKDLSIAVIDARRGVGNGRVIPAGPLRARLSFQLKLVDCIVVMGADPEDGGLSIFETLKKSFHGPVLRGTVEPAGDIGWIEGSALLAYAGIANPQRFFGMLEGFQPRSLERRTFRDHHAFTEAEAAGLIADAEAIGAQLVTTEKDLARLAGAEGARAKLAAQSRTLPITVKFEERDLVRLTALIDGALKGGPSRG
ncbi:MAG TPA: tetraacyldisaccharide 4'-kinase [Hyphomicrobium sp.]|nr:tetraacyldisaccharide 4'-kinase [Hyphomicrobium sp.]